MGKKNYGDFRIGNVALVTLKVIAAAGLVSAVMVAPGVATILKYFPEEPNYRKKTWRIKNKVLKKLHDQGLVYITEKDGVKMFGLTEKGQKELSKRKKRSPLVISKGKKPKKWDKKWRVVIFDIPEEERYKRDVLRNALREFGFIKLQQSVWVYPYDCKSLVMLLRADFKLGKEVLVMEVNEIEESDWIRRKFNI